MFGIPRLEYADFLLEKGFKDIVVSYDPGLVKGLRDKGFNVHIVIGAFRIDNEFRDPKFLAEDPYGRKHIWFGSGCPNNPDIRRKTLQQVSEILEKHDVSSILLDGIRFASVGSGIEAFATCFCENCRNKAEEYGYRFEEMKQSVKKMLNAFYDFKQAWEVLQAYRSSPVGFMDLVTERRGLFDWLEFRERSVVEFIVEVRNMIKSYSRKTGLGAYVFTPSLAFLVGQNYRKFWRYLDFVKPMVYRKGRGVACLNFELAKLAEDLLRWNPWLAEAELIDMLYRIFGFEGEEYPLSVNRLFEDCLPVSVLKVEFQAAKKLIAGRSELHPIIMLDDPQIEQAVKLATETGLDGIDFFSFREEEKNRISRISEAIGK
ncbi:MAG: hypothetical protein FGF50_00290 [Candidatus Brockarchaeota archaeon]|nr:hypothetical protein [Candidatus Brockarchaeota archaeon]